MKALKTRIKAAAPKDPPLQWRTDAGIGWLTNGHWMLHQGRLLLGGVDFDYQVAPESVAKTLSAILDREVSHVEGIGSYIKKNLSTKRTFSATNVLIEDADRRLCRLLESSEEAQSQVFVQDHYLQIAFDYPQQATLYAKDDKSPLADADKTFIVMPTRQDFPYVNLDETKGKTKK